KGISLKITGGFSSVKPSVWVFRWGSNHFVWDNNFLKEFRVNAGSEVSYPYRRLNTRFNYTVLDNYTDFGPDSMPAQHRGGLSVAALYAEKELSLWKFHLSNQILIQKSSNRDILDLPLITLRTAGFFEHNFYFKLTGGNLNTQIGVELFYNTKYYGYGYVPATGSYFRQNKTLIGNYPYINAFLNVKIKRTRVFLVLDHINSGFTGYNYFMVPGYPMNVRVFRYGLAWTFYD
ncbi:MAG: putative porin, partial [Bacteroidales bacterium]